MSINQVRLSILNVSQDIQHKSNSKPLNKIYGGKDKGEDRKNVPNAPYLAERRRGAEYCLVLDLDETLVHFNEDTREVNIRPGCDEFL